ncbi:Putative cytochrome c family protein [Bradyrhizobium sp. ORS 278]|uniref:c-type cytochrome n=1 Tax=Bradyrhizobium sp. (strain ORS 278) TaxID=114615 RepID=UPI0001508EE3|nr:c-type cytochrome [Bradyrhizobium sp. ORS 278]CAL79922.1 Putative cytochrome c family protein [Bradyrhizobium sp. ORS 278]
MRFTDPWRLVGCVTLLIVVGGGASRAADTIDRNGFEAKLLYCKTCHGQSGQGYHGFFPIPRLAGQPSQYVENQLRAFIEHRRSNPVMFNVAHALSPAMVTALASHFKALDPKPLGGAPRGSVAAGRQIYESGLPDSNVPACSACHGDDGKGQRDIPRLAGQLYAYTVGQLTGWRSERGQGAAADSSAIMTQTAHNLTRAQVEAVAAYVANLQ